MNASLPFKGHPSTFPHPRELYLHFQLFKPKNLLVISHLSLSSIVSKLSTLPKYVLTLIDSKGEEICLWFQFINCVDLGNCINFCDSIPSYLKLIIKISTSQGCGSPHSAWRVISDKHNHTVYFKKFFQLGHDIKLINRTKTSSFFFLFPFHRITWSANRHSQI